MPRLLKGGTLIDHQGRYQEDLLIDQGRIAQRGPDIAVTPETDVIDVAGCQVMPGGVDAHTHFNIDVGIGRSCDDFYAGTRAAACGGTTTIIDHMGFGPPGCRLHDPLASYHAYAKGQAVIDYSFHGVVQHVDDAILDEMASMVEQEGISSFKLYLTYQYKLDDTAILRALQRLRQVEALATVHPENDAAIRLRRDALLQQGKTAPIYHALSRPVACEAEAIARMINLAALADCAPLYIVHLSNGLGLDYLRLAQRRNQPVWAETCPQYLLLDDRRYLEPDGLKYILSPPLRGPEEQAALWQGVADGGIATLATDHCHFSLSQRRALSGGDFSRCPNGLPGVENRLALLYSSGVATGRISAERFVALTSARPAQLFGLWPRKGSLLPGADADLVVFDPQRRVTLRHDDMHDNGDYSPYEGMTCRGWPVMTLSRGTIVWRDGVFSGRAGHGRFLRRRPFRAPAADALG
ncbi:dihydropyrimidinase [Lonsdalea populi]|uniref:Dihydropyrimidinase n=1 Tax=Lonsdalea populi TaxID=1172565 RepID=A0ABX9ETL2_9GAMM|nr:dihydropyrimidinase [Lonsdalea populi]OSM95682.1 dihydropyrimidinase [Lonsdalea populi]QPQ23138.1 dihydropyrimidinase [Lonsdalea populi]RAT21624.1 dihydropyrimidinase [Lonsdalea populi]RAT22376.1 dihydropyrimidinase [Lonsdalea populi]RAT27764.1 dihydropyrimidinase [Lonsdalea populi]